MNKRFRPNKEQLAAIRRNAQKLWFTLGHSNDGVYSHSTETSAVFKHGEVPFVKLIPFKEGEIYTIDEGETQLEFKATEIIAMKVHDVDFWSDFGLIPIRNEIYRDINVSVVEYDPEPWHDAQFPEEQYSRNPYGFQVSIEII